MFFLPYGGPIHQILSRSDDSIAVLDYFHDFGIEASLHECGDDERLLVSEFLTTHFCTIPQHCTPNPSGDHLLPGFIKTEALEHIDGQSLVHLANIYGW